ncbi:MAG: M48 family metalloprotease [Burkholderiales bacterium]|nr:M48 family metalloprotease [Burkholderiales bacterium]
MAESCPDSNALAPLPYHVAVVEYLLQHEPDVWRWAAAHVTHAEQIDSLRTELLRDTYRLDPEAHADVHSALATAMQRLCIVAPATLYQSMRQEANASLVFVPGEIHIILHGPILERMSADELIAVFGHELSHYLLWSLDDGRYLVADRILNDAAAAQSGRPSHIETFRRYALHTELFADRGSAVAAGAPAHAIAALVKVHTGIRTVDPAAYLRQSIEIEAKESSASAEYSHPETFIRARAVTQWWDRAEDLDAWLDVRLHGPLALEQLDLLGQLRLQSLTRGFLAHYLAGPPTLASDAVMAQLRILFPDWRNDEPTVGAENFASDIVDDNVRNYLNALMVDLALADPDQQEAALIRAGKLAQALGSLEGLQLNLKRDAGFGKRELDRYKRQLAKEAKA